MWETSGRLLRLLELLQTHEAWTALDVSERLGVTTRTVRRDMSRLRDLGYPIVTNFGSGGGYLLEPGAAVPPVLFNADEAVAALLALRAAQYRQPAENDLLRGASEKLVQTLPGRIDTTLRALDRHSGFHSLAGAVGPAEDILDITVLIRLARACRERRRVEVNYLDPSLTRINRRIEPLRLAHVGHYWYLIAYCLDRREWALLRVDRLHNVRVTEASSYPRHPPAQDLDDYIRVRVGPDSFRHTIRVRVHAEVQRVWPWVRSPRVRVQEEAEGSCVIQAGVESLTAVARWLLLLDAEVEVLEPPGLADAFRALAERALRAAETPDIREVGARRRPG